MRKAFMDVTPQVTKFDGQIIELGMVRYEINSDDIKVDPNYFLPGTFITQAVPLELRAWAKIQFKVELKSADVAQPTKIAPKEIDGK